MEKKRHPALILLMIPLQLLIDLVAVWIASEVDLRMVPAQGTVLGHPMPGMTMVVTLIFSVITIIVILESVIRAVVGMIRNSKKKRDIDE